MMLTNYERVTKIFMPAFRLKAAQMMVKEYGIKQQQAAEFLGTTQAAISKYLKQNANKYKDVKIDPNSLRNFIERMQIKDTENGQKIVCSMCQINKKFDCTFINK